MPNRSKQKGDRAERAIVDLFRSYGLDAYRVPLSGAASGFKSDVELRLGDKTLKVESKARDGAFKKIYEWLSTSDVLVIKADREKALAVIPLELLANLIAQYLAKPTEKVTDKRIPEGYQIASSLNPITNSPHSDYYPSMLVKRMR